MIDLSVNTLIWSVLCTYFSGCAHMQPASQPSSVPTEFVLVEAKWCAPETGFFATVDGVRTFLKARSDIELALKETAAEFKYERDADAKALGRENWWSIYGVWVGGALGLIVGGLAGYEVAHR